MSLSSDSEMNGEVSMYFKVFSRFTLYHCYKCEIFVDNCMRNMVNVPLLADNEVLV